MALRSFSQWIGYYVMCVMPAEVLSPEAVDDDQSSSRHHASSEELSYCHPAVTSSNRRLR